MVQNAEIVSINKKQSNLLFTIISEGKDINELNEDKVSLNVICYCLLESKSKLLDTFCKEYNIDVLELKNIIIRTLSRTSELDNILDLTDLCKVKHDPLI